MKVWVGYFDDGRNMAPAVVRMTAEAAMRDLPTLGIGLTDTRYPNGYPWQPHGDMWIAVLGEDRAEMTERAYVEPFDVPYDGPRYRQTVLKGVLCQGCT